jgi:DNA polymerase I
VLVGADYSQIELRVAALLSGDRGMLEAYQRGDDLHRLTAAHVAGVAPDAVTKEQRQAAKAVNFGTLYGQRPAGLAENAQTTYGVSMTRTGRAGLAALRSGLSAVGSLEAAADRAGAAAETGQTRLGLVRDFDIQGQGYLQGEAVNIPVQGSAAEVLMAALARLPSDLSGIDAHLYHNVHDELVLDVAPEQAGAAANALRSAMVAGFLQVFPEGEALTKDLVETKTGRSWAEVH